MAYPSTISTLTNPQPTDRLNSPSHSSIETAQNTAILEIQRAVGDDTSVLGTIMGDLRNPDSKGGGHVQGAAYGGTGQTTYIKGDLIVAQSPSVLSKLAVSSTVGNVLVSDPNQTAGMKWAPVISNKIATSYMGASYTRGISSIFNVIFAASILSSTFGTNSNNAIRYTGTIPVFSLSNTATPVFRLQYGTTSILSITPTSPGTMANLTGTVEGMLVARGTSSIYATMAIKIGNPGSIYGYSEGLVGVDTNSEKPLFVNFTHTNDNQTNSILSGMFVVEKIA